MLPNWKPSKIFYGWWVVGASFLITLYWGGMTYGFTAIFEPVVNETGWSYTQVSLAVAIRSLEFGILAPIVGIFVDRVGPRRLIFSGTIIIIVGLLIVSRATSLAMFWGGMALTAIGSTGCTSTVLMTNVANWFKKRVGIASGIVNSGFGFGGLLIPVTILLIDLYEWRTTMAILALGLIVTNLPLSFLFRHKPEQYGLLPDGEIEQAATMSDNTIPVKTPEIEGGVKQTLKSRNFWLIAMSLLCFWLAFRAVITHVMPYLSSIGIARSVSGLVATSLPLVSIGGRLGLGWLGDKLNPKIMMAAALTMASLGVFCFEYTAIVGPWLLVPFLILFSLGFGGISSLRAPLLRRYFGRSRFGTLFGLLTGIAAIGTIVGAPLAGWVYDSQGSYQGIWLALSSVIALAVILVLSIRPVADRIR